MSKNKKKDLIPNEEAKVYTEDVNEEFGEMIPSSFGWVPPDEQKKKAEKHEKL